MQANIAANTFWRGFRAELPIWAGVLPFGMIFGALASGAGFDGITTVAMSVIVFAGSSQLIALQLMQQATPIIIIYLTGVVVNFRHALYSASVAPYLKKLPSRWKFLLAYLLTDEAYAVAIHEYQDETKPLDHKHWFLLGTGVSLWSCWFLSTILGVLMGNVIPPTLPLEFSLPLVFLSMVVPAIKDKPLLGSALTAAVMSVATYRVPLKLGLIISALAAIGVGLWLEKRE